MRSLAVLSLCALAHAAPRPQTPAPAKAPAPVRGTLGGSLAGNSLKPTEGLNAFLGKLDVSYQSADDVKAGCTDIIAVIARGSMEPGNIVRSSLNWGEADGCRASPRGRRCARASRPSTARDSDAKELGGPTRLVWSRMCCQRALMTERSRRRSALSPTRRPSAPKRSLSSPATGKAIAALSDKTNCRKQPRCRTDA